MLKTTLTALILLSATRAGAGSKADDFLYWHTWRLEQKSKPDGKVFAQGQSCKARCWDIYRENPRALRDCLCNMCGAC